MSLVVRGLPKVLAQEHTGTEKQEPAHAEEEHNPVLPEADELIYGSLAFLLIFVVLWRFAIPRISKGMEDRRQKIQGDLEEAERSRQDADRARQRYEQQLNEARGEANRIIEEARKTADSMRKDLLAKAEEESRQIVARAQEEIKVERDRAFEELRASVGDLSLEIAERVIGRTLDKKKQASLVDDYIDELAGKGNGKRGS